MKTRSELVRVAVVQARLLGRLRHTEVIQMDAEATDPTPTGWSFVVRLKGGTDLTEITIPRLRERALCAVHHLTELRDRLRSEKAKNDSSSTSFWLQENGSQMTVPHLRKASAEIIQAAGSHNSRGYLLKHAMMTALREAGMLAEDLAQYARHKPGSTTFTRYVDWSDSLKAGVIKVTNKK
jgi:integrase